MFHPAVFVVVFDVEEFGGAATRETPWEEKKHAECRTFVQTVFHISPV